MPYRDDEEAVEARRIELERELAEVKERSNEYAYLSWKKKELETELVELKKRKATYARKRLPMLQQAKIASPCSASWEKMEGNDQVRFCGGCQKNVYDLSAMTSQEAEGLLQEKEGNLCARFYRRVDGTIMTSDCSVGVRKKRVRRIAGAAVLFGSAAMAVTAYGETHKVQTQMMGAVATLPEEMGSVAPPVLPPPPVPTSKPVMMGHVAMGVTAIPQDPPRAKDGKNSKSKHADSSKKNGKSMPAVDETPEEEQTF